MDKNEKSVLWETIGHEKSLKIFYSSKCYMISKNKQFFIIVHYETI